MVIETNSTLIYPHQQNAHTRGLKNRLNQQQEMGKMMMISLRSVADFGSFWRRYGCKTQ